MCVTINSASRAYSQTAAGGEFRNRTVEQTIAALASEAEGIVTRAELIAADVTEREIDYRLQRVGHATAESAPPMSSTISAMQPQLSALFSS